MPPKNKYKVNTEKLSRFMVTYGLPPPRASRINNGYWVQAARMVYGRNKPSFKSIVAVSNYWYYNLRGFKTGIVESNKVNTGTIQEKSDEELIEHDTNQLQSNLEELLPQRRIDELNAPENLNTDKSIEKWQVVESIGNDFTMKEASNTMSGTVMCVNEEESEAEYGQEGDEDPELFCLCQQPYDETRGMIMCDYCGEFYHMECIDINKEEAEGIKIFICQICSDGDCNSPLYHEEPQIKLQHISLTKSKEECKVSKITTAGTADNSLSTITEEEPQYFTAIIIKNTSVALQKEEWEKMGGGNSTLQNEWKEVVTSKLESVNPHCSFAYSWRWKKKNHSRKESNVLFRCRGRCSFSDCSTTFIVAIKSSKTLDMEMIIEFSGAIRHRIGDTKARNITTPQRQKLRAQLQNESPSTLRAKRYLSLTHSEYMSGKRDIVGRSASVYQKISSEGNLEKQAAGNVVLSLMKLRDKLIETDKLSRVHQGFIHHITAVPFGVVLFTELGLRIYHQLSPLLTIHCDATGTIVQSKESGKLLYYALVLRHPEKKSPVAVAEFITASQSVVAISHFLEIFRRTEAIMYGYGNLSVPFEVLIDRSIVLLISFLKVFNNESLSSYLHRCFRLVMNCSSQEDSQLLLVHACISHVMNSVKKDIKKLFKAADRYKFVMFVFSVLVNATTMEDLMISLRKCKILFCSKLLSDDVAKAHQYFIKEISIIGENRFTTTTDDFVPNLSDDESGDDMSSCMSEEMATFSGINKPFGSYVAKRLSKYPSEVIKDNACARNEYYIWSSRQLLSISNGCTTMRQTQS